MSIAVQIPYPLRHECGGKAEVEVSADSVQAALAELKDEQPKLYRSICDETGAVRRHINLFVNETLIHRKDGLSAKLGSGDLLFIMTAVSGG
ncbi:MoaD/ThiS family protein [Bremerella sp.]|uniref:MoaD/ThiS family protein n=1 Tax=Bremerella sp. TaxID=2795602 RepID=UPI0039199500